tara:strand:+ start:139 stop:360 length:222 start_codon:yes stop_codon:yes gene_type:complete
MFNFESNQVLFPKNFNELQVTLKKTYTKSIVIKITASDNVNINLKDITNTYFTIEKSVNKEITVHYIVIESES